MWLNFCHRQLSFYRHLNAIAFISLHQPFYIKYSNNRISPGGSPTYIYLSRWGFLSDYLYVGTGKPEKQKQAIPVRQSRWNHVMNVSIATKGVTVLWAFYTKTLRQFDKILVKWWGWKENSRNSKRSNANLVLVQSMSFWFDYEKTWKLLCHFQIGTSCFNMSLNLSESCS